MNQEKTNIETDSVKDKVPTFIDHTNQNDTTDIKTYLKNNLPTPDNAIFGSSPGKNTAYEINPDTNKKYKSSLPAFLFIYAIVFVPISILGSVSLLKHNKIPDGYVKSNAIVSNVSDGNCLAKASFYNTKGQQLKVQVTAQQLNDVSSEYGCHIKTGTVSMAYDPLNPYTKPVYNVTTPTTSYFLIGLFVLGYLGIIRFVIIYIRYRKEYDRAIK